MKVHLDQKRLERLSELAHEYTQNDAFSSIHWSIRHAEEEHTGFVGKGLNGPGDPTYNPADSASTLARPLYRIYSMTKPIVAVMALILVERGQLVLASPVANYLPAAAYMRVSQADGRLVRANKHMTVEHLLTHRAGFSYDFLPECSVATLYREQNLAEDGTRSLAQMVDKLLEQPLCFEPGTQWKYSYSMDVLARVLEVVGGKPLQTLLAEEIFAACDMQDTTFCLNAEQQRHLMPMFGRRSLGQIMCINNEAQTLNPINVDASHPVASSTFARGGHGLYSSIEDYMAFVRILESGKTKNGDSLLSKPMIEFMWQNRIPESQQPLAIGPNTLAGYGWNLFGRVVRDRGQSLFLTSAGEGGWAGAACTYFWVDPQLKLSGTVMTQYLDAAVPLGDFYKNATYQALV